MPVQWVRGIDIPLGMPLDVRIFIFFSFFYHLMRSQAGSWLFFVLRSSGEPKQFFICAVVNLYFWGELSSRGNTKRELCRKGSLIGTQGGDWGRQSYGLSEVRCSKVRLYWVKPWRAWLAFFLFFFFCILSFAPFCPSLFFSILTQNFLSFFLFFCHHASVCSAEMVVLVTCSCCTNLWIGNIFIFWYFR